MLWKSRFPEEELKKLASTMPAHAVAGQYQQRPTAREGGLFKREWFKTVRMIPESATRFMVRAWDLAASADGTKSDPDWTAGVLMARDPETKMFFICDVVRQRWSAAQLQRGLLTTAHQDKRAGEGRRSKSSSNPADARRRSGRPSRKSQSATAASHAPP